MKKYTIFCLFLLNSLPGFSQDAGKMKDFYFMQGIWKGEGWSLNAGAKEYFKETETVALKLSGTALQIEAYGIAAADPSRIINDALGILKYNNEKAKYELHIFQSDGSFAVADVKRSAENEMEWRLVISPALTIKYIITVTGKQWKETGYRSADGGLTWQQHFEMQLSKVS